jgi:hypothetical protein
MSDLPARYDLDRTAGPEDVRVRRPEPEGDWEADEDGENLESAYAKLATEVRGRGVEDRCQRALRGWLGREEGIR